MSQDPEILLSNTHNDDWLEPSEVASLTVDTILDRLRAITGLIAAHAREAELQRRPVDAVWSAIRKTGVFYMFVPKKYGGMEVNSLQALTDAVAIIGEHCASTAWCTSISIYHQLYPVQFTERFQDEIWFKTPYFVSAGSAAPPGKLERVEGGFRATGRWKWASGIMHATWANSVGMVTEADGSRSPYLFFVPIEDVEILDTWFVDGMCGTGSHDYRMTDVFVPEHRAVSMRELTGGQESRENPFHRIPVPPALALVVASPAIGVLRGAVKRYRERLASGGTGDRHANAKGQPADNMLMHAALGKAELQLRAAELLMQDASREFETIGSRAAPMSLEDRVRVRGMYAYATEICRNALRALNDDGGSSAHFLDNPSQRALRDVTVAATHKMLDYNEAAQLLGRAMIGLKSNNMSFT